MNVRGWLWRKRILLRFKLRPLRWAWQRWTGRAGCMLFHGMLGHEWMTYVGSTTRKCLRCGRVW